MYFFINLIIIYVAFKQELYKWLFFPWLTKALHLLCINALYFFWKKSQEYFFIFFKKNIFSKHNSFMYKVFPLKNIFYFAKNILLVSKIFHSVHELLKERSYILFIDYFLYTSLLYCIFIVWEKCKSLFLIYIIYNSLFFIIYK